jgi:hypothetical protein
MRCKSYCLFLLVPLLFSCRHEVKQESNASPYFTHFITDDGSVLRGVNFNVSPEELKKTEKSKLYESTADHLFYEFTFPKDSTAFEEYSNIQYFFDENDRLDIITADVFVNDSVQESKLKKSFGEYFDKRYGDANTDEYSYDVWKGKFEDRDGKKYNYTVGLKEMDDDYGISLEYLRE